MEIEVSDDAIKLDKVMSVLDEFVADFIKILNELNIKYVIISGYVVLLFGRQRITEDIDIFLEELDESKQKRLFDALADDYWIINASTFEAAEKLYIEGVAWRVAKKDTISPNMEVKKPKSELDFISLNNSAKVILNKESEINISPLELQIAYKMFLGSRKDLEDARFLYDLFKDKIDKKKMLMFADELKVSEKTRSAVL